MTQIKDVVQAPCLADAPNITDSTTVLTAAVASLARSHAAATTRLDALAQAAVAAVNNNREYRLENHTANLTRIRALKTTSTAHATRLRALEHLAKHSPTQRINDVESRLLHSTNELSKRLDYTADTRRAMRGDTNQLRRRTESARLENSAALQNILDRATQDHDRITALEDQVTKLLAAVREAAAPVPLTPAKYGLLVPLLQAKYPPCPDSAGWHAIIPVNSTHWDPDTRTPSDASPASAVTKWYVAPLMYALHGDLRDVVSSNPDIEFTLLHPSDTPETVVGRLYFRDYPAHDEPYHSVVSEASQFWSPEYRATAPCAQLYPRSMSVAIWEVLRDDLEYLDVRHILADNPGLRFKVIHG